MDPNSPLSLGASLSSENSLSSTNQDRNSERINFCDVGKRAQGRTLASFFELADVGYVISQHLRDPLLTPIFGNSQPRYLDTKGLSKISCQAFLDGADGFCHIGIINRCRELISGTIDPQ